MAIFHLRTLIGIALIVILAGVTPVCAVDANNNQTIIAPEDNHIAAFEEIDEAEKTRFLEAMENKYKFQGKGVKSNPFLISSVSDLKRLRDSVDYGVDYRGYYFRQTADLRFPDGENWDPIGHVKDGLAFRGVYDGAGHVISNLRSTDQYAGLFSLLDGEVRNLGIESGRFEGDTVGSITSHGTGLIINCYNKAEVVGYARAGGLTDNYAGKILFCWNLGSVSGTCDDTIVAGLDSYGSADIQYSYTTEAEPVSPATFSGELTEVAFISKDQISSRLERSYAAMANQDRNLISGEKIYFLLTRDGVLKFYGDTPHMYFFALFKRYIPLEILTLAALLLLFVMFAVRVERRKTEPALESKIPDRGVISRPFAHFWNIYIYIYIPEKTFTARSDCNIFYNRLLLCI